MKPQNTTQLEKTDNGLIQKEEPLSLDLPNNTIDNSVVQSFYDAFRGREDVVGLADTLSTQVSGERTILKHLEEHLTGKQRLGFYNLNPNGTANWAMVEFEQHGKSGSLEDAVGLSEAFLNHMRSVGINAYREMSKNQNGKCFHIWIFFDKPISAKKVQLTLKSFVKNVLHVQTEIFPKGYDINKIGNFVWLPYFGGEDHWGLGIHRQRTVFIDETTERKQPLTLAEFLAHYKRVTEADLDRLISEYHLSLDEHSIGAVGEAIDGLEKVRQCSFMKYCEEHAANLDERYWYAWITNAVHCKDGIEYIHEYSSKDPRYTKQETDKKVAHALADTGPMKHETIMDKCGYHCDCPGKFKAPVSRAYYRDIPEEIKRIQSISDGNEKIEQIRKLLYYWSKLEIIERDYYKNALKKGLNVTEAQFKAALSALTFTKQQTPGKDEIDYSRDLRDILADCRNGGVSYEAQGNVMYEWLKSRGVKFFKDKEHNDYLFSNKQLLTISRNDREFESFLYHSTGITTATKDGEVFIKVLQAWAEREGLLIDCSTWLYTDVTSNTIYFNLNNERHELVKISPMGVEIVENGSNNEQVLLHTSKKILPLTYTPLPGDQYTESLIILKRLVIDNMACQKSDRLLAYAWRIAGMFIDYTRTTPHLRFEGDSNSGKSVSMELISLPLYGADRKKKGTTASNFSDGARNPLVLLDNVETKNMDDGLIDFIITAVTGITKEKRKGGTDHDNVEERTKCLICSTGIEPLALNEIINRTYTIDCDKQYHNGGFYEGLFNDIKAQRDAIMSAEFQLIGRILKKIEDRTWQRYTDRVNQEYRNNSKERANSFLALTVMIAEELLSIWEPKSDVWDYVKAWINTQDDGAGKATADTNPILLCLNLLRKEAQKSRPSVSVGGNPVWNYDVEILANNGGNLEFRGYAKDFHATFATLCRSRSLQYPYETARVLAKRIKDSKKMINAAGWEFTTLGNNKHVGNEYLVRFSEPTNGHAGNEFTTTALPPALPEAKIAQIILN